MEFILLYTTPLALFLIFLIINKLHSSKKKHNNLPPSPGPPLPIIGHLHLLKQPLHRTFQNISLKHGSIFSLELGVRRVVMVSSLDLVEECSTTNDVVFSNRPRFVAGEHMGYNHSTVASVPYGRHWRSLRRMAADEVLSSARLDGFSHIRRDEVERTLQTLTRLDREWGKVELRKVLFELIFNILMRMLAGKRYSREEKRGERFREMMEVAFSSNAEDFLPFLKWIDYRGLKKKMGAVGKKMDDVYQDLLEEHRLEKRNTIIGHLLSLQESDPEFYSDQTIKAFMTPLKELG